MAFLTPCATAMFNVRYLKAAIIFRADDVSLIKPCISDKIQEMNTFQALANGSSLEGLRELLFSLRNLEENVDQVHPRGQHDVKVVQLRLALRPDTQEVEGVEYARVEVQGGVPDLTKSDH